METNAIEEPETTTTIFRGVETYGSLFDFQYARWNGVHYQTDYSAVSYEDLDDLAGFSVAIQSESDRVYTILVKGVFHSGLYCRTVRRRFRLFLFLCDFLSISNRHWIK